MQDVRGGRALVENRYGAIFDVGAGSILPGLGRVETIKRQDNQWVVVTARGLISPRRDRDSARPREGGDPAFYRKPAVGSDRMSDRRTPVVRRLIPCQFVSATNAPCRGADLKELAK